MTTEQKRDLISVEDYLAREKESPTRNEYLGGVIYAMAGSSNRHALIASNILIALGAQLRGRPCRAFNSDTKIRIQLPTHTRFYYPDVSVVCTSNRQADPFQDSPSIVIEVLSKRTRRSDEGEKKDAYLSLPSLSSYLLVEQDSPLITLHRRTGMGFAREVHEGLDAEIGLEEIGVVLLLREAYESVDFSADTED